MAIAEIESNQPPSASFRRAARGIAHGAAGRVVFYAFGYLATIVLARSLGPVEYGNYGVILSLLVWVEQVGRFTLAPAATRLIPQHADDARAVGQTAVFLNAGWFLVLFGLFWFAAPLLAELFHLPSGSTLFRLAAIDIPFFGMWVAYRGVLLGHRAFTTVSIADVLYALTKLVGVVLLLAVWMSIPGALVVNVLASIGALLFAMSRISVGIVRPAPELVGPLLRLAVPFGLYMLALQTTGNLDLWFLKALSPTDETPTIGLYVAARNVAIVPGVILLVVSEVLLPSLSRAFAQGDSLLARRYLRAGVRFLCLGGLPIAVLFGLVAEDVMVLLYSDHYGGGGEFLQLLIFSAIALAFVDLFASALHAHGDAYRTGATLFVAIVLGVFLNVTLISRYGAIGAATTSAITGLLGAVMLGVLVHRRFGSLLTARTMVNVVIAALMMSGVASLVSATGLLLVIACVGCVAVYVAGLVVLREITWEDLEPFAFWRSTRASEDDDRA